MNVREVSTSYQSSSEFTARESSEVPVWANTEDEFCEYFEVGGTKVRLQNGNDEIRDALKMALPYIKPLLEGCIESIEKSVHTDMQEHFFREKNPKEVLEVYKDLLDIVKNTTLPIEYEDSCRTGTAAYVYGIFSDIHLCPAVLERKPSELAGTIIHELTHIHWHTADNAYIDYGAMPKNRRQNNAGAYNGYSDTILYMQNRADPSEQKNYEVKIPVDSGETLTITVENCMDYEAKIIADQVATLHNHCLHYADKLFLTGNIKDSPDVVEATSGNVTVELTGSIKSGYDCEMEGDKFIVSIPWLINCMSDDKPDKYLPLSASSMYEAVVRAQKK